MNKEVEADPVSFMGSVDDGAHGTFTALKSVLLAPSDDRTTLAGFKANLKKSGAEARLSFAADFPYILMVPTLVTTGVKPS